MTRPLTPAEAAHGTAPQEDLWKPVLLRAIAALGFGAVTIFWATPSVEVMAWAGGIYALATGVVMLWGIPKAGFRRDRMPGRSRMAEYADRICRYRALFFWVLSSSMAI